MMNEYVQKKVGRSGQKAERLAGPSSSFYNNLPLSEFLTCGIHLVPFPLPLSSGAK